MNASSESGLWATWMVVIGSGKRSLRSGTRRGERGIDVVPVQEVLGERRRALRRLRGEESRVERAGARVALLHAGDPCGEDEAEQVRRPRREDRVGLGAGEHRVPADLAEPAEVVAPVSYTHLTLPTSDLV